MKKDFLRITDITPEEFQDILNLSLSLKKSNQPKALEGRNIVLFFEKPSTRTRVSFEVAVNQLGGSPIVLTSQDMQLSRGETIADTARVMERYVDVFVARVFKHETLVEFAKNSTIPIVNSLSDLEHPCQILADYLTMIEKKKSLQKLQITYLGDGNNVSNSLLLAAPLVGADITVITPKEYSQPEKIRKEAGELAKKYGTEIQFSNSIDESISESDVLYTDTWISMGDIEEKKQNKHLFKALQINAKLLAKAKKDAIVMHCLPAHRNDEITDEVMDGKNSVVFDQAENRLHAQKALLVKLLSGK